MNNKDIVNFYLDGEVLLSPDILDLLVNNPIPIDSGFVVMNKDTLNITTNKIQIQINDFEKALVQKEKHKNLKLYNKFLEYIQSNQTNEINNNKTSANISSSSKVLTKPVLEKTSAAIDSLTKSSSEESFKKENISNIIKTSSVENDLDKSVLDVKSSLDVISPDVSLKKETEESDDVLEVKVPKETIIYSNNSLKKDFIADLISSKKTYNDDVPSSDNREINAFDTKSVDEDIDYEKKMREKFYKDNRITIVSNYKTKSKKWSVQDFVSLYNARYRELEKILRSRQELSSLTSVARINAKKERENVAMIGVVYEKAVTKAGNIMFTVEDPTGMIKVVVNQKKEDMFKLAEEIQLDEVIGIAGMYDKILFANTVLIPDIPLTKELKKSPEEGYFVIISDTQLGSKLFLEKEFIKFISWVNGEIGNEKQKEVAAQIKYIFIGGDLVDGVGIYPNQEYDLNIIDIRDQYKALAVLLKQIPDYIPIIICPGNHDVGRISEPQPALTKEYAEPLISMSNVISLSNPSIVNIYAQPENGFDGFNVMFYHGYSFVYYSEKLPDVRRLGGQKRPDLIMKYLLQRRHLAPSHTSTLYIPDPKHDPLVIDKVPDFLITGHIHRASVSSYKNVTCFNASCWVAQSDEQERRGLEPQPGRAFIVNMKTREVKMINFLSKEEQDKEDIKK